MDRRRLILALLLVVSFDLAAVAIPTPRGVVWDEDEEVVHLRRPSASPLRLVANNPVPAASVAGTAPRPAHPSRPVGDRVAATSMRPRADLSAELPAPSEDH